MSAVDADAWTCPNCSGTTRGNSKERRTAQRRHAREHDTTPQPSAPTPRPPGELVIPAAPKARRRAR